MAEVPRPAARPTTPRPAAVRPAMDWEEPQGARSAPAMQATVAGAGFNMVTAGVVAAGLFVVMIGIILDMILTGQIDSQEDATFGKTVMIVKMAGYGMLGGGLVFAGLTGRGATGGVRVALIGIGLFALLQGTMSFSSLFSSIFNSMRF